MNKKSTIMLALSILLSISYIYYGLDLLFLMIILISTAAFRYSAPEIGVAFFGFFFVLSALLYSFEIEEQAIRLSIVSFAFLVAAFVNAVLNFRKSRVKDA